MKICPKCSSEVDDDATFCPKCGARLDSNESFEDAPTLNNNGNGFHLSKTIVAIAIIVIAIVVLALSCPDKQAHVNALNSAIISYFNKSVENDSTKNAESELALGLVSSIVPKVVNSRLEVKNYFIFSVGELSDEGKSETVSLGILGHVFPLGLKDPEKRIDEVINGKHEE